MFRPIENEHVVASVLGRGSLLTANIADGGDSNDSNDRDDGGDDGARDTETVSSGMHGAVEASLASVAPAFRLRTVLPQWPRRGRAVGGLSLAESRCLVRCDPEQDRTHGFFVACFERHSGDGDSDESRDGGSDPKIRGCACKWRAQTWMSEGNENALRAPVVRLAVPNL